MWSHTHKHTKYCFALFVLFFADTSSFVFVFVAFCLCILFILPHLLTRLSCTSGQYYIGYAFAFGGQSNSTNTTFMGTTDFASVGDSASFWFFQYTFSATSVTIVAGTLAERCQMAAYLCYSIFLAGFVYPIVAHSVWSNNGFLSIANVDPLFNVSFFYLKNFIYLFILLSGGTSPSSHL